METLNRISNIYENVRKTIKNKGFTERPQVLKQDIQSLQSELVLLGKENHDQFVRSLAMDGYLAMLSIKTIPLPVLEKRNILHVTYEKLKPYALREECLFILLRIQNLLCYYMIQLDDMAQAREILESMEELYGQISSTKPDKYLDAEDLFKSEPTTDIKGVDADKIDKVITNNIQMQAYLYNKLNLPDKYTLYNHTALRRQLEMKEGTPQDWALRISRLGNYFTYLNQLDNARYHLCASYYVLKTCHENFKLIPEEFVLHKADFESHFLELSHHWVKYGLTLLKMSKKKILKRHFSQSTSKPDLWKIVDGLSQENFDLENDGKNDENAKDFGTEKSKGDSAQQLFIFPTLDLKDMLNKVPLDIINTVEEARTVFIFTYKWLMRAKHYYDFDHHPAQYISCSLQLAELYEHLAFFERNIDNQYRLQKKRSDVLEALNSLLKTCDNAMSVQIDIIKELSQVQLELMALNLQKLWREESQTNILNMDVDVDSILNFMDTDSSKTLTEKTLNASCRNTYLKKMEAASAMNGKLSRLSGQLGAKTPSELSLGNYIFKN